MDGSYPKRRRYKDNPYSLWYDSDRKIYIVSFTDGNKKVKVVEVSHDIYNLFNSFELKDVSHMNEYDRHIEHAYQSDELADENSIEEEVIKSILYTSLRKKIKELPDIQRRRIIMYYFNDMTLNEIAQKEKCTPRAVKFSIDIGLKKLYEALKDEKN